MSNLLSRRAGLQLMGGASLIALTTPAAWAASPADTAFAGLTRRWLESYLSLQPVGATAIGDHRFDGEIDDMSPAGRARQTAEWRSLLDAIGKLDRASLSRDNQVDAAILGSELKAAIWDDQELQSWAWDARVWSELAGNALYLLMARDFAPLPTRLKSAIARMQKLPVLLAQMRGQLVPARVPPIHAKTVAKQNSGVMDIVDSMILPEKGKLGAADQKALTDAAAKLRTEMAAHQVWLDKTLVPAAKGNFRIGAKRFDEKLVFTLNSNLDRATIRARAEAAVKTTRAAMYEAAVQALAGKAGAPPTPKQPSDAQQQAAIVAALALVSANRPARDKVVEAAKKGLADATAFVKAKDLITLPTAPVQVILMPKFERGVAVAYCDPPGPLDKGMSTFYAVSPIPDEWTQAQTDSFLREYNNYGITDIAVHEAMPGHYVQLWHSNKCPSMVRAVLGSGSFVEGWAVYAENLMADQGFMNHDPLYRLAQLKVYLRSVTNAILDQGVHAENMSREDAMHLMTVTAFQEESEAAGKWDRASMSATQLSTYFVGRAEHDAMRAEAERQRSFMLKQYHDKVLSYGSAPARYVSALMFDKPII